MDNLTHSLAGVALSRAGLNKLTPHATWVLVLAVNAPDIDAVSALGGPLNYLNWHRDFTHSVFFLPLLALLPVLFVRLILRKPLPWKGAYLAALVGVVSHPLLDATNIYGVPLLLPLSPAWFRLDITNVVDIWIWAALLLATIAPLLSRLVAGEIGAARGTGRGWGIFALAFLLLYNGGRSLLHARAVAILDARLYRGSEPLRVFAGPGPWNPLEWKGVVETAEGHSFHRLHLLEEFDPSRGVYLPHPEERPAIEAARANEVFRDFLAFSQWPAWRVTPISDPENGSRVEARDLRFSTPTQSSFVATAILDAQKNVVRAWFAFNPD
jgi:inner membrane protein